MASSSSSATVAVEKATSDLLMGPDWTMNIEICDSINSNHWQPKDVVKAVKKRIQHKSTKVQLLALTLLETMVKNCGDQVHFQIAERNILDEMIKIVRKKAHMQVRDKILVLLDSWQEAFGGPGGKYPQYYWAYEELKRTGVVFPKRSLDASPIFTPPPTHQASGSMHAGYGMPSGSSKTLDETMATEIESLSLSSLESMRHVMDLLSDMLQAVNPSDRTAVKDEVIVDLVDRCRTNQKKLMQMLTTTGDEELLGRGLELNDSIQSLLAKHDAIATGNPLPIQRAGSSTPPGEVLPDEANSNFNQTDVRSPSHETDMKSPSRSPVESISTPKASPPAPLYSQTSGLSDEEEEDEFAQLARRHSKTQSAASMSVTSHVADSSTTVPSNALALPDPPAPVSTGKDQDIIDLLSLTLSLTPSTPQENYTSSATSVEGMHQAANPSTTEGYSNAPQTYPGNKQYNSYVAPWARPQSPSEPQVQSQQQMYQPQSQSRSQSATPPSYESEQSLHNQPAQFQQSQPFQQQNQPPLQTPPSYESEQSLNNRQTEFQQSQPFQQQTQPPLQSQHPQYSASPQYQPSHAHLQPQPQHFQAQPQPQHFQGQLRSPPQPQLQSPPQHFQAPPQQQRFQNQHIQYPGSYPPPPWASTPGYPNYQNHLSPTNSFSNPQANTTGPFTFPSNGAGSAVGANFGQRSPGSTGSGQRPFIPSYRLFEDLNVFGNTDGRVKMTGSGTSSGMSGTMGPGMVGGRK
ncbi:TOM1-like protein 6 [Arachis stenosperma]|uniref:TOM1-like protein 6 n=1 Tax=Arachis stenosperma TaxID=217475 RepID=UPI0025AD84EB|nr:TOM1-like protein 6 [Arachis stenosperma]XP_057733635.1 TOM1-like protein 6 [Arachis stenosperma]